MKAIVREQRWKLEMKINRPLKNKESLKNPKDEPADPQENNNSSVSC